MEIYAPNYYKNFKCIASDCNHSCCIGWQIEVDSQTLEKYAGLNGDYADKIRCSLSKKSPKHFKLTRGRRCPHLDEKGLCKIILNCGEDCLCEICREHPRFYNQTDKGLLVGLGISCPTACKIVLTADDYCQFFKVGCDNFAQQSTYTQTFALTESILKDLSNRSTPLLDRIAKIEKSYGVSPTALSDERWKKYISALEFLTDDHRESFLNYTSYLQIEKSVEPIAERALAYFIYRHLPTASSQNELRKTIGFCLFCAGLLISLINRTNAKNLDEIVALAVTISEEIEYSLDNQDLIRSAFEVLNF